jgi:hypothetical protein
MVYFLGNGLLAICRDLEKHVQITPIRSDLLFIIFNVNVDKV